MNIKTIAVLVIGIIIGISFSNLFKGCNDTVTQTKIFKPETLKNQSVKVDEIYQHQIDSLQVSSNGLAKKLAGTKQILSQVSKKNKLLQMQVYELIDKTPVNADTIQIQSNCDSLKVTVAELLQSDDLKDSLFTDVNNNLETQIKNKDSTLMIKDMELHAMRISLDQSITEQQFLYDKNKTYQKQFKRQKVKSKLLSVGALILSGMAAAYLIQQ